MYRTNGNAVSRVSFFAVAVAVVSTLRIVEPSFSYGPVTITTERSGRRTVEHCVIY